VVPEEKQQWVSWIASKNKYYESVHKIKEPIREQPSYLKGGQLKPYQVRAATVISCFRAYQPCD